MAGPGFGCSPSPDRIHPGICGGWTRPDGIKRSHIDPDPGFTYPYQGPQGPSDRFGFDRFEHFATQHGCTITVVNQESLSPQEEMVEDPMTVVPAFSCRLYGLRAYRKQIREAAHHG